jgi:hypothetical protein
MCWSTWTPENGKRGLRVELTAAARTALEQRRDELAPFIGPFHGSEMEKVGIAISDMFSSFRSMRQTGESAVAVLESVTRLCAPYPAWAIVNACHDIQSNGVWRNGQFDRQWPPNDSEIVARVRQELRLYADSYNSACALLAAKLEEA